MRPSVVKGLLYVGIGKIRIIYEVKQRREEWSKLSNGRLRKSRIIKSPVNAPHSLKNIIWSYDFLDATMAPGILRLCPSHMGSAWLQPRFTAVTGVSVERQQAEPKSPRDFSLTVWLWASQLLSLKKRNISIWRSPGPFQFQFTGSVIHIRHHSR